MINTLLDIFQDVYLYNIYVAQVESATYIQSNFKTFKSILFSGYAPHKQAGIF